MKTAPATAPQMTLQAQEIVAVVAEAVWITKASTALNKTKSAVQLGPFLPYPNMVCVCMYIYIYIYIFGP